MSQVLHFLIQVIADIPAEPEDTGGDSSSNTWLIIVIAVVVVAAAVAVWMLLRSRRSQP